MNIIFSRKGFDNTAGGGPSPIVGGVPISLPIPDSKGISPTSYDDLNLAEHVVTASRGKLTGKSACHHDPMFRADGSAILGQCGASQSHLANKGVGPGDLFVFFGLFEGDGQARHHRIFGYLRVAEVVPLAGADAQVIDHFRALLHPHAFGMHAKNDTLYVGEGRTAAHAPDALRLSVDEGPVGLWRKPPWLRRGEISYFPDRDENWPAPDRIYRVGNGQEFVAPIADRKEPRDWAAQIIALIES